MISGVIIKLPIMENISGYNARRAGFGKKRIRIFSKNESMQIKIMQEGFRAIEKINADITLNESQKELKRSQIHKITAKKLKKYAF